MENFLNLIAWCFVIFVLTLFWLPEPKPLRNTRKFVETEERNGVRYRKD